MAWIEVHQSISRHNKTLTIQSSLKCSGAEAVGLLVNLWLWALDSAPDGDISDISDTALGAVCDSRFKGSEIRQALVKSALLDADGHIHKWDEYAGKLLDKRATNAARMKRTRAAVNVQRTCSERAAHVQLTCDERAAHVQGTCSERATNATRTCRATVQYSTIKEEEEEEALIETPAREGENQPLPPRPPPPPPQWPNYITARFEAITPENQEQALEYLRTLWARKLSQAGWRKATRGAKLIRDQFRDLLAVGGWTSRALCEWAVGWPCPSPNGSVDAEGYGPCPRDNIPGTPEEISTALPEENFEAEQRRRNEEFEAAMSV